MSLWMKFNINCTIIKIEGEKKRQWLGIWMLNAWFRGLVEAPDKH